MKASNCLAGSQHWVCTYGLGELCKYIIPKVKFWFSAYFPRMPLHHAGKDDRKLGPEECPV
jgi:hypothetical protein